MGSLQDLNNLKQADDGEVGIVSGLVTGLYGNFHPKVEIMGVYFSERRHPFTVYTSITNRFLVAICLPQHQADDPLARLAHLSHELVHCLNPNGPPPQATMLEEGLAEHSKIYLSREFYQNEFPSYDFRDLSGGNYRDAFDKIEELVDYEELEGMRRGVRALRAKTRRPFCKITEDDLARHFTRTPATLLRKLSQPFHD